MTITVIFFESALELIPESLRNHSLIRKEWKNSTKRKNRGILLDRAIHSPIMKQLPEPGKQGRPDIVYYSLLNLLYSPLVADETIKIIIHTITNHCILIPSQWRIPVNYNRFLGLFAQLLYKKRVPLEGEALLTVSKCTLEKILMEYEDQPIFLLEEPNDETLTLNKLDKQEVQDAVFLIGGFQSGDSSFPFKQKLANHRGFYSLSLYEEVKPAWIITSKLVHWLEDFFSD
jgi:rRNA small subunit pseudouridine methyltransferase Nep1